MTTASSGARQPVTSSLPLHAPARAVRLVLALLMAAGGLALAQECNYEREPNDAPAAATVATASGPDSLTPQERNGVPALCFSGDLGAGDTDHFSWRPSEADALHRWVLHLDGAAGQTTTAALLRLAPGGDEGADGTNAVPLLELSSVDGRSVTSPEFLLERGTYLLRFTGAGAEPYAAGLRPVSTLNFGTEQERFDEFRDNRTLAAPFGVYGPVDSELAQPFTVPDDLSGFDWDVVVWAALGTAPRVTLSGPGGVTAEASVGPDGFARLPDLALAPGEYVLQVVAEAAAAAPGTVRARVATAGRRLDGVAIEPNDAWDTAGLLRPGDAVTGGLSRADFFRLEIDEADAAGAWDVVLESDQDVRLAIDDEWGRRLWTQGATEALGLRLSAGAYRVVVEGPNGAAYRLAVSPSTAAAGDEEPNDTLAAATPLPLGAALTGRFVGRDTDTFSLEVAEGRLYGVRLESTAGEWLRLIDPAGGTIAESRGNGPLRLDDLLLMPGVHHLAVLGRDAEYSIEATAVDLVPPPGVLEIEPNDDASRAIRLEPGAVHVGRLTGGSDDYYRFHLADDQYVRLTVTPPAEAQPIRVNVDGVGWAEPPVDELGAKTVAERYYLAGDHSIFLRPSDRVPVAASEGRPGAGADGYYQLTLEPLGRLLPPVDAEPNDSREQAGRLPAELTFSGVVGQWAGDQDFFALPRFASPTEVSVAVTGVSGSFGVDFPSDVNVRVTARGDVATGAPWVAELPADTDVWLRFNGRTAYSVTVSFAAEPDVGQLLAPRSGERLSLSLDTPVDELAAFWHEGQTALATATLENNADVAQTVTLQAASSHATVVLETPAEVTLAPGESRQVPLTAHVPSDLRDDLPVTLELAAVSDADSAAAAVTLAAACEAAPVGPTAYWPLPDSLLARSNVLWSGFGASGAADSAFAGRDAQLIDGRTGPATAGYFGPEHTPTFELAGDAPVTLLGTVLNPQVGNPVRDQLRRFRIETSLDGSTFTPAFEGELRAARFEQAFVFDRPVSARYARLVGLDNQAGGLQGFVGEWKLIAEESPLAAVNLADPALGGHVVWTTPYVSGHGLSLLKPGDSPRSVDVTTALGGAAGGSEFVVGFHNARAGQIERFEWLESQGVTESDPQQQIADVVRVAVSLTGGAGPWRELAEWQLERDADGRARLTLDEPVWARYVRFTVAGPEGVRYVYLPDAVSIYEREASAEYPSMLAEYGNASRNAVYEYLNPRPGSGTSVTTDAGDTRELATPLASGASAAGSVTVAEDVDWYRLSLASGENHLELRLSGDPGIAYRYELQDAAGQPVAVEERSEGDDLVLTHFGEPGDYYLLIEEPKRTVVFNWDTSGSVSPYLPITYNSLARFAADVSGDREAVQLLAFDDPAPKWLLPFWSSETQRVQRAIVEFDRRADSSNAESSLLVATEALADREGTRAILLMTDAESGTEHLTPELWQAFDAVRPRIFTFEISTAGNDYAQDLMQDWADVNGGVYTLASGVGDFDAGFSRASCILRRPKSYRVDVVASYREPPGPGTLTVTRAEGAARAAVEVIFDASGSMGRALPNGEQRIDVAKRALRTLVNEVLPEGTPFALRAFGHIAPSSCETRLDLPLAPLDRARAAAVVGAIEPKLLSQTPLADSLAALSTDLASATAGRTVILITDGVESCRGDPAAAVAALREGGLEFALAIVSLGLEADDLAAFQDLAEAVGASYVDVTSLEELQASIEEALNPAFEVVDAGGTVVARGRVGGAGVELPMGVYTVRVLGAAPEVHPAVRVPGDTAVTLSVGNQ